MPRSSVRRVATALGHRLIILGFTAFAVFPFYWMVVTTFKQNSDLYVGAANTAHNPFIFNRPPTLEHLQTLFEQTLYLTWLVNTLLVGALVVAITLLLAVPAGYSLARLTGRWGERLSIGIFLTYLIPSTLLVHSRSRAWSRSSGFRTPCGPWSSSTRPSPCPSAPGSSWASSSRCPRRSRSRPWSTAAAGRLRSGAMVLPLAVPGILTVVIFALTLVVQEFVYSLTFISSVQRMTVSVGVPVALIRGDVYYWGSLMAACVITSLPLAILYNFFLDRFIAGFTVGAVQ